MFKGHSRSSSPLNWQINLICINQPSAGVLLYATTVIWVFMDKLMKTSELLFSTFRIFSSSSEVVCSSVGRQLSGSRPEASSNTLLCTADQNLVEKISFINHLCAACRSFFILFLVARISRKHQGHMVSIKCDFCLKEWSNVLGKMHFFRLSQTETRCSVLCK